MDAQIIPDVKKKLNTELSLIPKDTDVSKYTEKTWNALKAAETEAQQILASTEGNTQNAYYTAWNQLRNARLSLIMEGAVEEPDPITPTTPTPPTKPITPVHPEEFTEGNVYECGSYFYKVTSLSKKTVTITKAKNTAMKKIVVPNTIKLKNISYKVTAVGDAAFQNYKQATNAKIGKNVISIGRNAFAGCKKLKKITIKSKVLKTVGKTAFKGIHKKAQIKVPAKKLKQYKKILNKKGQGKNVKLK